MNDVKRVEKEQRKNIRRKRKKNALVMCHDGREYWTTQTEFWQWVRGNVVVKVSDGPLRGMFVHRNEEYNVLVGGTVLNLRCPNHLREVVESRRKTGG